MNNPSSRTVLIIGAAVVAGGMVVGDPAQAQAPAAAAPPPRKPHAMPMATPFSTGCGPVAPAALPQPPPSNVTQVWRGRGGTFVGLEADGGLRREANDNLPLYKPEFWDQITENEYQGNWDDPVSSCIRLACRAWAFPPDRQGRRSARLHPVQQGRVHRVCRQLQQLGPRVGCGPTGVRTTQLRGFRDHDGRCHRQVGGGYAGHRIDRLLRRRHGCTRTASSTASR